MILTHEAILEAKENGEIIIDPFEPNLVSINSVDVCLGPDLWKLKYKKIRDLYAPSDEDWIRQEPISVKTIRKTNPTFGEAILRNDDELFLFNSGEFYLATTKEKIGSSFPKEGKPAIVPEMKAKSTVGRQGLTVALCAGLGDVGYSSRWALEVRVTDDGCVPIAIGTPIAQVVFSLAMPTKEKYNGSNRYQDGENVRFLPKGLSIIRSNNG